VAVPNRLRELREQRELTRRELSIRLDVTESTIERWEMSKTRIPDERKLDIAKLLDVTPSELMGWD
jgi:transcriptional regulator with XRE-family HTH domain